MKSVYSLKAIGRLNWVLMHLHRQFAVVAFVPAVDTQVFQQAVPRFCFDALVLARSTAVVALFFTWTTLPPYTASPTPTAFQQIRSIDGRPVVWRELEQSRKLEELEVSNLRDDGDNVCAGSSFNCGKTHTSTEYQTDEDGDFRRCLPY